MRCSTQTLHSTPSLYVPARDLWGWGNCTISLVHPREFYAAKNPCCSEGYFAGYVRTWGGDFFGLLCYQAFSKIHNRPNLAQPYTECLAATVRAINSTIPQAVFSSIMLANKEAWLGKTLSIKQTSPTYFHFDQGNEVSREQGRQSSTFSLGLMKFTNKKIKKEREKENNDDM